MQKSLSEISLIRPIVIIFLVLYHSFAPNGIWSLPVGQERIIVPYYYFSQLICGFLIETFIMIGGYVFYNQYVINSRKLLFFVFFKKKFIRLIMPSLIFGVLYLLIIKKVDHFFDVSIFVSLLTGVGHLWFLPMMFWLYMLLYCIYRVSKRFNFYILLLASFLSVIPIPSFLGISSAIHYLFYAYIGFYLSSVSEIVKQKHKKYLHWRGVFILLFAYFIFMFKSISVIEETGKYLAMFSASKYSINYMLLLFKINLFRMIGAVLGVFLLYYIAMFLLYNKNMVIKQFWLEISTLCYGIYIYHQFILKLFYYNSGLSILVKPFILPFVGFVIAFVLSFLLTKVTLKNKIGKLLIG